MGVVVEHYFDDFIVEETKSLARSGQEALRALSSLCGLPFAKSKEVDASDSAIFLGVESNLADVDKGLVYLRVRQDRLNRLQDTLQEIILDRKLSSGAASSLAGRLAFTLSWGFGRIGRAAMQPIHAAANAPYGKFDAGTAAAVNFFADVLPLIPPHVVQLYAAPRKPVLVWTDGASEGQSHTVGWVIAAPIDDAPDDAPFASRYTLYHGSAQLSQEMVRALLSRQQQIGQVEILGALCPYLSMPELLAGRDVIHWIDNTSAQAALTKGYSGVPDSARLVHLFHAWNCAAGARVWFEYIPSKSNPADEPSRIDLSDSIYVIADHMLSSPRPTRLPEARHWADPAGWMREAQDLVARLARQAPH